MLAPREDRHLVEVFGKPGHIKKKEVLASDAPGGADAEIAEFGGLVGGIPTLHDLLEALRLFVLAIALEPFRLEVIGERIRDICSTPLISLN